MSNANPTPETDPKDGGPIEDTETFDGGITDPGPPSASAFDGIKFSPSPPKPKPEPKPEPLPELWFKLAPAFWEFEHVEEAAHSMIEDARRTLKPTRRQREDKDDYYAAGEGMKAALQIAMFFHTQIENGLSDFCMTTKGLRDAGIEPDDYS